jgi:sugar phosphate isomerase/epimerase
MQLSVSTATLFWVPFKETLAMIAEAGFQNVELDLYWERKEWASAQHLKGVSIRQAVRNIEASGLRIISIHDGGGVLKSADSISGFINPDLDRYLDAMGYAPECIVFHTPHVEGSAEEGWFGRISGKLVEALDRYRPVCALSIENMQAFAGYTIPLSMPDEMKTFVNENILGVTMDTSHYTEMGVDILQAAEALGAALITIHLSDGTQERRHVFIGDGELNLAGLLNMVDRERLRSVNLECTLSTEEKSDQLMDSDELISRMREARLRLETYLA